MRPPVFKRQIHKEVYSPDNRGEYPRDFSLGTQHVVVLRECEQCWLRIRTLTSDSLFLIPRELSKTRHHYESFQRFHFTYAIIVLSYHYNIPQYCQMRTQSVT